MPEFLEFFQKEGAVILHAPVTFLLALALLGGVIWLIVRREFTVPVANLESELRLSRARNDDYEAKLHGKSPSEAAAAIEDLKNRLAAMEPLSLSSDQLNILYDMLSREPAAIEIVHDGASFISKKMHSQLVAVFKKAGWLVTAPMAMGVNGVPGAAIILTGDVEKSDVNLVVSALKKASVRYYVRDGPYNSDLNVPGCPQTSLELLLTTPA